MLRGHFMQRICQIIQIVWKEKKLLIRDANRSNQTDCGILIHYLMFGNTQLPLSTTIVKN